MKKDTKVLYWIEEPFIDFGIAKHIQEKIGNKNYGIVICNNTTKKFFEEQNLVEFEKIWFYRNIISSKKQKVDMKYLKYLENNLEIQLWRIVYGERFFTPFSKYHLFKREEILSIIEQEAKLYEEILDEVKPDFLVMRLPDFHNIQLLYEIARAKNVKIMMVAPSRLGGLTVTEEFDEKIEINNEKDLKVKNFDELKNQIKKYSNDHGVLMNRYRTSKMKKLIASIRFLFINNKEFTNYYQNKGKTKTAVIYKKILDSLRTYKTSKFIQAKLKKNIPENSSFIYFPLHVEPEQTLLIRAPYYTDQLNLIKNIAKSLPIEFKLFVKEHPAMKFNGWQSISFYKEIISLPNVELFHPEISNEEFIEKCKLVISIAGTAGLQAAFYQKPSIVLADVNYTNLSSVYKLDKIEELGSVISKMVTKEVDILELNEYMNKLDAKSFNFESMRFATDAYNIFGYGGFLAESNVTLKKMNDFLSQNNEDFELLSSEIIKKITNFEKMYS